MPRTPVPPNDQFPYHVTARCVNREPFPIPLPEAWALMEDFLFLIIKGFEVRLHSFVLMPNHFHLIISTPRGNISESMNYFMRETSKEMCRLSGRINQTYGSRHYKSLIPSHHYFMNAYKYVYRNPVRASLCRRVEEYPFSTLSGLLGQRRIVIPIEEDTLLFERNDTAATIDWLNQTPQDGHEEDMRIALKKAKMKFNASRQKGRPSRLETDLL